MSVFHDQHLFMTATDQEPDADLYYGLVCEEGAELDLAWEQGDMVQVADGIMDSIYVLAGLANSLWGPDKALQMWEEVQRSNMSKVQAIETIDGVEYVVKRRDDGKILKPESYFKPDLERIIGSKCNVAP